jgi:hypothetical protein
MCHTEKLSISLWHPWFVRPGPSMSVTEKHSSNVVFVTVVFTISSIMNKLFWYSTNVADVLS